MEQNREKLRHYLIIIIILLVIPLIVSIVFKNELFYSKVDNNELPAIHLEDYKKTYCKKEPSFGKYRRANSSSTPVRYEKRDKIYKYITPTIDNTARIMCAGDLMCEPAMSRAVFHNDKFFFESCFAQIRKVFKTSDFAIANLETAVAPDYPYAIDVHKLKDRYHCNAPIEYLDALRYAGLDAVTTANNHTCDTGANGLMSTIENIKNSGLLNTGSFTSPQDKRYLMVDINGIKVAFFSYTEHFNSNQDKKYFTQLGRDVMLNLYSKERVEKDLKKARNDGAEFTIVYIHFWCKDYTHEVQETQIKCAKEIAEAGADCIVGGHPHAVQPYDEIITSYGKRVPVNYCLGNFITSDANLITRTSYIYELFLEKNIKGDVYIKKENIIPCKVVEYLEKSAYTIYPTPKNWRNGTENALLQKAENEIKKYVGNKISIDYNN